MLFRTVSMHRIFVFNEQGMRDHRPKYLDLISQGRENTADYFPSLHIDRGAAEVHMARKIIKLVFSRPREIRFLSEKDQLAHHCLSTRKCETKASSRCVVNACKRSAGTDTESKAVPEMVWSVFSTYIRQLADSPGEQTEDSWAYGLRFKSTLLRSLCYFTFCLFQIEILENSKSFRPQREINEETTAYYFRKKLK